MANEERDKCLTKAYTGFIARSCSLFTGIKSTDHRASSNQNMPVTWHGPEPGIGLRASIISDSV
jgi:hypothetical protein